jgi:hypothetical protein
MGKSWQERIPKRIQPVVSNLQLEYNYDVNGKINQLTYLLHKTADKVVPKKTHQVKWF